MLHISHSTSSGWLAKVQRCTHTYICTALCAHIHAHSCTHTRERSTKKKQKARAREGEREFGNRHARCLTGQAHVVAPLGGTGTFSGALGATSFCPLRNTDALRLDRAHVSCLCVWSRILCGFRSSPCTGGAVRSVPSHTPLPWFRSVSVPLSHRAHGLTARGTCIWTHCEWYRPLSSSDDAQSPIAVTHNTVHHCDATVVAVYVRAVCESLEKRMLVAARRTRFPNACVFCVSARSARVCVCGTVCLSCLCVLRVRAHRTPSAGKPAASCASHLSPTHTPAHTARTAPMAAEWASGSWRTRPALQQPEYRDAAALDDALRRVHALPPLVHPLEIRALQEQMAQVGSGWTRAGGRAPLRL